MLDNDSLIIMLIEDDPGHAEIIRRNFKAAKVMNKIIHLKDGQAALDYLFNIGEYSNPKENPKPNVIFTDLRLPKVEGLEVLRRVKADEHLRRIPVIILSTSESDTDIKIAYQNYANSYIVKPVDFDKMKIMLETIATYWVRWNNYPLDNF